MRSRSSSRRSSVTGGRSSGTGGRSSGTGRRSEKLHFDEFGFAISKRKEQKLHHRSHDYRCPQMPPARVKELCELLSYWNGGSFICRSQIERFIRMGVPPSLRGRVWKCLLAVDSLRGTSDFDYQTCLSEVRGPLVDLGVSEYGILSAIATLSETQNDLDLNQQQQQQQPDGGGTEPQCSVDDIALFRQIALDLRRSFPTHRSLMGESPEAIEGQAKLFRVLIACAKYNPRVGYSQGMSYIAAVLLMQLGEEEAFWALTALLDKPKYLAELFDLSLSKVQHQAKVFEQLLRHRKPQLARHLESVGVLSVHFVMPWFLTLFTSLPCWDSVLAVWDVIILHGLPAVFRTALTLVDLLEPRLMSLSDEGSVLPLLLRVPVDLAQYPVLLPALWSAELQDWELRCMNSLVLDEATAEEPDDLKATPSDREEARKEEGNASPPPAGGNATEKGAKSVLVRVLRLAQRYLLDPASRPQPEEAGGSRGQSTPRASRSLRSSPSVPESQVKSKRRGQPRGGAGEEDATGANTNRSGPGSAAEVSRRRSNHSIVHRLRLKSLRLLRSTKSPSGTPPSPLSSLPPSLRSASFAGRLASPAGAGAPRRDTPQTPLIRELSSRHQSSVPFKNATESQLI